MTAIPPDIQKAAAAVYARLGRGADVDEQAIAKALMAERERAAQVADAKSRDLKVNDLSARQHGARQEAEGYAYASDRCAEIAAAIRSPHPSPTGA